MDNSQRAPASIHLPPGQVADIIQKAWDEKAPDVMRFGLAVAHRIEEAMRTALAAATGSTHE